MTNEKLSESVEGWIMGDQYRFEHRGSGIYSAYQYCSFKDAYVHCGIIRARTRTPNYRYLVSIIEPLLYEDEYGIANY